MQMPVLMHGAPVSEPRMRVVQELMTKKLAGCRLLCNLANMAMKEVSVLRDMPGTQPYKAYLKCGHANDWAAS